MQINRSIYVILIATGLAQAGARFSLGGAASVFQNIQSQNLGVKSAYTFYTNLGEPIPVMIEDFYLEEEQLSMTGEARESGNSEFILKGTASKIYGWVALKHRNLAYEYTTDENGLVHADEVPITKIFPVCDFSDDHQDAGEAGHSQESEETQSAGPEPHIGPYPGTPVNKFQSKPGAPKVLYWDISQAANIWTPSQMWEAWQGFSATLSMFDVNVTTDPAVWAATPVPNRGRCRQLTTTGRSSCALNKFGTASSCTIYKKPSPRYQGGTLGHEVGHLLGLSHDGRPGVEYFPGFETNRWVPMMGRHISALNYGSNGLMQYSKGEYSNANQRQDDFRIITVTESYLAFRAKTHTGIVPLKLSGTATVAAADNRGQIVKNTDTDVWSFSVRSGGGRVVLRVDRTERAFGSMLDVEAVIRNAAGTQMARSNGMGVRYATFDLNLQAGNYTLEVKGGAEGTPLNGFSNYSSLGFYAISGTITGANTTAVASKGDIERLIGVSIVNTMLNLDIPSTSKVERIRMYSTSGKVAVDSRGRVGSIDMTRMLPGIYVLGMKVDGATVTRKVSWSFSPN